MLQEGLDFSATGGPVGMVEVVEHFKSWNGEGDFGKWSVDQVVGEHSCNHSIYFYLSSGDPVICDPPAWQAAVRSAGIQRPLGKVSLQILNS